MITYTLKIINIRQETRDTITICFKQPGLRKVRYLPGQYITLILTINGRRYKRPYSLSSSPDIDTTLNITVKRVPKGIVSNYLCDTVKTGDTLEVLEPLGNFVLPQIPPLPQQLFLWGAGSGITPLYSILRSALYSIPAIKINLVYCNRSCNSVIFGDQLAALLDLYPDQLSITNFHSQCSGGSDICHNERLSKSNLQLVLNQLQDPLPSRHYICGPVSLKDMLRSELLSLNVPDTAIFSEQFEHLVNEEELKNVHTQNISIIINNNSFQVEVVRGKSILEACLDRGIDMPYSCQNGTCTLCKASLLSGEIKSITAEDAHTNLSEHEKLLCCSYPLSKNVSVLIE